MYITLEWNMICWFSDNSVVTLNVSQHWTQKMQISIEINSFFSLEYRYSKFNINTRLEIPNCCWFDLTRKLCESLLLHITNLLPLLVERSVAQRNVLNKAYLCHILTDHHREKIYNVVFWKDTESCAFSHIFIW